MIIIYLMLICFFSLSCVVKKSRVIMLLQFIWAWLLYALNTGGADYIGNEGIYYLGKYYSNRFVGFDATWLANLLYSIFNRLNMSYMQFNLITGFVAFAILFYVIWKISKTPNIIYTMIMIYPMTEFVIQKRFFLAISIIILGIYLFSVIENKVKKNIVLLICILLSCGLHFSSVFYFTLFYMNIDDNKGIKYKLKILIPLAFCFIIFVFISTKVGLISQSKITSYMQGETSRISIFKLPYFIFLQLLIYYITIKLYKKKKSVTKFEKNFISYSTLLLFLIPTYAFNTIFRRYYIHLLPLNYLIISDYYKLSLKKKSLNVYLSLAANITMLIYLAFIETRFLGNIGFDELIVDLYRNNLIFKYLII